MTAGLATMLGVLWRTQRRAVLVWVVALNAGMVATAAAVAGLYDTPAKIHTYASAVTSGNALVAINGRVEGIDSLGGVIQGEFGFLAAFLLPLLGISLVARSTRREEQAGRLETVLGGRLSRYTPTVAALLMAAAVITLTVVAFAVGLAVYGVPLAGAVLYSASLGALAFVFAGLAALVAQLALHSRGVYTWGLIALAGAYALRGFGDVTTTWLTWLSPLGWAEKAAPFGAQRWWALGIPLLVGLALGCASVSLAARRDVGSALVRGASGPAHASAILRRPLGLAVWTHRPSTLGWCAGSVLFAAMMGALAQQFLDAILGNHAMAEALGATSTRPLDGFVAVTQLYLAIIACGYAIQAVGVVRDEEAEGRLETRLAGTLSRRHWLATHGLVIVGGLVVIVVAGSLVFAVTTAASTGNAGLMATTLGAGLAYLPAELVLAGLAFALFGRRPRLLPLSWAAFAFVSFVAFLGPSLRLPGWALDLAPTTHVGMPPQGSAEALTLAVLSALALALAGSCLVAVRARDIPQA